MRWSILHPKALYTCRVSVYLTGKPTERRHLGRVCLRLENKIRIHFEEISVNVRNCLDWDEDYRRALVNAADNFRVP